MSRRFTGGILALALLAVMGAGAAQFDGLFDTLELDGELTWNAAVLDPPNTGAASNRVFFRGDGTWSGVGLADACHDVLDATVSTMSTSAWETLITCTVDVPETTDRVLASVAGQFAWMGTATFVVDDAGDELCEVPDPTAPAVGVTCRALASSITNPRGVTTRAAGGVYIVNTANDELCEVPDPTAPAVGVTCRALASSITSPRAITTRAAGGVWIVDTGNELCEVPDPTAPAVGVTCRALASSITSATGVTTRAAGGVYIAGDSRQLCEVPDPTAPAVGVTCRAMAPSISGTTGVTTRAAGGVYIVATSGAELCEVPDPTAPAVGVTCLPLASSITDPQGITEAGADGECMIRLARGATAIETLMIDAGRILLDTTFVDVPGVAGSATYNVQMMTANPFTLCTAVRGNGAGTIPLPSLLVQVFYGS